MAVDAKPLKISKKKAQDAKSFTNQDKAKGKSTLKERQEKKYPFPDSDVASMLDELLKSKVIELLEMKRPEESGKVDDPNYCKYHRLVSHPVGKCFVLKDKIMELHSEGLIEFEEEVASSNVASITRVIPEYEVLTMAIKFGLFDPIILPVASTKLATSQQIGGSHFSETYEDEDNEGWTLKKKESSQPVKRVDEITKNLGNLTLPLTSLQKDEVTKPSLKGFVRPSKGPLVEHDELPSQRANCFDPNAYRLLVKAGYDHEDVTKMANETRTIWQKKVKPTKQGLGFSPVKLKIHKKTAAYITADEVDENDESMVESPRISVFDRLGRPSDRQSVFDRLSRPSALNTKRVVRFAKPRKPSFMRSARREKRRSSLTSESNEFHSKFPSRMERRNELVVTTGETLRAKAHTGVVTSHFHFER
ncbi:hypothetical protein COLO4_16538 [Corchorus olitorius]|uniref:Ty3-gypsy retrotransposon protein n=1 Tax=Corchorus olitorius TaxID=93759 RepID=A0A1R3JGX5_9ROSI|nr:hypothetical protein COLO4_16538 [Corchorus olitorius]